MVYESDFYTTRRYRTSPSLSTYTVSYSPSRQVRLLPGIGKVHVVHTYDRIVPYVGHKRLTVVSPPPQIFSVRPSVLLREFDRISYKYRPAVSYSYVNNYLNSNSAVRLSYIRYPITDYRYSYTPASSYYHSVIGRPLRLYHDILGYPRWSRSWYRYWDDIPRSRYSNYYADLVRSSHLWPSYSSRWYDWSPSTSWYNYLSPSSYKSWYPSLTSSSLSTYYPSFSNWYPSLRSWYNYGASSSWYKTSPSWYRNWYPSTFNSSLSSWYPSITSSSYSSVSPYWSKYYSSYDSPYYWSTYWQPSWSRHWRSSWNSSWTRWHDLIFNDETSRIRADAAGLLKRIHTPVVRTPLSLLPYNTRYSEPILTSRITSDDYIYKMLSTSPYNSKSHYTTYYSEPIRRYIGPGHLAAVSYAGGKAYGRRPNVYVYDDPVKDDIHLLSYYINKFRSDKALASRDGASGPLSPARPSRHFSSAKTIPEPVKEEKMDLSIDRASIRLGRITEAQEDVEAKLKRQNEIAKKAEEKALAEEAARKKAQALKEEAARKAELARQEELAAQAAAERAAEMERKAEQARQDELAKQAEIERIRQEEEERELLEAERRLADEAKAEEERQQLIRLEEIAREAEEERERGLARQAEELAELARQEAELEEQARQEADALSQVKKEEELAELAQQEAELQELERQEKELAALARQESEIAHLAKHEAELAKQEAEIADLATQEAELKELKERQQAELDALEAEAKALEETYVPEEESAPADEEAEDAPVAEEEEAAIEEPEEEPVVAEPEVQAEEEEEEEEE